MKLTSAGIDAPWLGELLVALCKETVQGYGCLAHSIIHFQYLIFYRDLTY